MWGGNRGVTRHPVTQPGTSRAPTGAQWPLATRSPVPAAPPSPPTPCTQVREVTSQYTHKEFRWKAEALLALQEMAEAYLVALLEDA